jgi:hypothetical protein
MSNDDNTPTNVVQGMAFKEYPDQSYDSTDTTTLLDLIFHGLEKDEHIVSFLSKDGAPRLPVPVKAVLKKIRNTVLPHAFYFGTSSVTQHADGKIYNRKAQFSALHCVVLDDIGTKIDASTLPKELVPNYIIESSAGNYQYGFILAEPIRDIALADALIHIVYTSGYTDGGGKLVTKAVRLPAGVNCKVDADKMLDPVSLVEVNDDFWTAEDLINVLDTGITWDQVVEDPSAITKIRTRIVASTSPWAATPVAAESAAGIVDPLLEWMYDEDMVLSDPASDWVQVECPWHKDHTNGNPNAGYSPVGRGGVEYENQRGFSCKHGHCVDHKTADFIQILTQKRGAPEVPIHDLAAGLVRDFVFDQVTNSAIQVANCGKPFPIPMVGFRGAHPRKVKVYLADGKTKMVTESAIWENAPHRTIVSGETYAPNQPSAIVTDKHGVKRLNKFIEPAWGAGNYDQEDVDKFIELAHYLMPNEDEYEYVMAWLAAKATDRTFKGNAILMVATTQGIGRTLFTDLLADMFTRSNCNKVTFKEMVGDNQFNEWQSAQLVFCDEVMTDKKQLYSGYETLKDLLDPRPKEVMINVKYGGKYLEVNYASYILLTNHAGAIGQLRGDRRIYVVSNPQIRQAPSYYAGVEEWRNKIDDNGDPSWIKNVWRWLRTQPYDLEILNQPVPETRAKEIMRIETDGIEETLLRWCFDNISPAMPSKLLHEMLIEACDLANVEHVEVLRNLKPAMKALTLNAKGFAETQRVNGKVMKFRVSSEAVAADKFPAIREANKGAIATAMNTAAKDLGEILENKSDHLRLITELAGIIEDVV